MLQHTGRNGGTTTDNSVDSEQGKDSTDFMSVKERKQRRKSSRCLLITVSGILFLIFCGKDQYWESESPSIMNGG